MLFTVRKAQLHVSALVLCSYMIPNQPRAKPPTPPLPATLARSRIYTSPLHPIHPLQMHVNLTDKFPLYNLKMAIIYDRNM